MTEKKELQKQCEGVLDLGEGELSGEKILNILKEINRSTPATIYWGCITEATLNDTF